MHRCVLTTARSSMCYIPRSRRWLVRGITSDSSTDVRTLQIGRLDSDLKGVVTLEMTNPKANALGFKLVSELEAAVQELSQDESVRAVVISSGVPGVFCAGADLKERASMSQTEAELFVERLRALMTKIAAVPVPTIAAVEGAAYGGGLELMLACDLRVVGEKATMGLTETSLGIIPGAGGTQRLPRLIGASKAKELIFTARRLDAARALELGMVNAMVGAGRAHNEALSIAGDIAKRGPLAIRAAKLAIDQGLLQRKLSRHRAAVATAGRVFDQVDSEEGMAIERAMYARVLETQDRNEGLEAFKEKRAPVFTGK